jgi:hypothetical protein
MAYDTQATFLFGTEVIDTAEAHVSSVVNFGETHCDSDVEVHAVVTEAFTESGHLRAVASHGHFTIDGTPVANETFAIDDHTFTFQATRTGAFIVAISADNTEQAHNICHAVNMDIEDTIYATHSAGVCTFTAVVPGVAGDGINFVEAATGVSSISGGGHLASGVNTAMTGTVNLALYTSATLAMGSPVLLAESGAIAADLLVVGYRFKLGRVPTGCLGYLRLTATVGTHAQATGHIMATLVENIMSSTVTPTTLTAGARY